MNKLDFVHATANAICLARSDTGAALRQAAKWSRFKRSMDRCAEKGSVRGLQWTDGIEADITPAATLYMSFHYGAYLCCVGALARRFPNKRIYWIISTESRRQESILLPIAADSGVDLAFLSGGASMLRGLYRAIAEQAVIFVLIDLPWGINDIRDRRFAVPGGVLQAKSQLFKLCERAGLTPQLLVADYAEDEGLTTVRHHGPCSQDAAFAVLAAYLGRNMYLWERLNECHTMAEFDKTGAFITFATPGGKFLMEVDSRKMFRLPPGLRTYLSDFRRYRRMGDDAASSAILDKLRLATGRDIRAIL
jgi:hypothetical protein